MISDVANTGSVAQPIGSNGKLANKKSEVNRRKPYPGNFCIKTVIINQQTKSSNSSTTVQPVAK